MTQTFGGAGWRWCMGSEYVEVKIAFRTLYEPGDRRYFAEGSRKLGFALGSRAEKDRRRDATDFSVLAGIVQTEVAYCALYAIVWAGDAIDLFTRHSTLSVCSTH